ncbi:MAG: hypothetical protein QW761_02530, partial [Candidatus Aenigmatarchaeota archaeon]
MKMMKICRGGHIILPTQNYIVLEPVLNDLMLEFLYKTRQLGVDKMADGSYVIDKHTADYVQGLVRMAMADVRSGNKPAGYNDSEATYRLIFPICEGN